jgi:hypothetical protein
MRGNYDYDARYALKEGQTMEQIAKEAKEDPSEYPARKRRIIAEDRAEVLKRMGLKVPK